MSDIQQRGVGSFFFAAIPWILAIGASAWLAFYVGLRQARSEFAQQERMATYVGAAERPAKKMKIETEDSGCVVISRADYDGDNLIMYAENRCDGRRVEYLEWHWRAVAPDGTNIKSGYTNLCPLPVRRGEKAECDLRDHSAMDSEDIDDRTAKLVLSLVYSKGER